MVGWVGAPHGVEVTMRDTFWRNVGVRGATEAHDWKRRSERLVRASGRAYTLVRPGWFDYNQPDELRLVFLQGDTRHAGDPSDGVIARRQIAQLLVCAALVGNVRPRG
jgi:uncharacterized protein YbjT (DUF2867 family)